MSTIPSTTAPRSTPGLRAALVCLVLAFGTLFVLNTFVTTSPDSLTRAERYFSKSDIERGLQFSYERKLISWCGIGLHLALLTALVNLGSMTLTLQVTGIGQAVFGEGGLSPVVLVEVLGLLLLFAAFFSALTLMPERNGQAPTADGEGRSAAPA